MKKTITPAERMSLIGLLTVGSNLNEQLSQVEQSMLVITGEECELGGGHCSDSLYGGEATSHKEKDVDRLLERLKIKVSEESLTN